MSDGFALAPERSRARIRPVTDPLRVMVIDPHTGGSAALGRALDRDPDLAVVSLCGNLRGIAAEVARCRPDVVAVRLAIDDERCAAVLAALAGSPRTLCVAVLGRPGAPADALRDSEAVRVRLKAVAGVALPEAARAETARVVAPDPLPSESGKLLN